MRILVEHNVRPGFIDEWILIQTIVNRTGALDYTILAFQPRVRRGWRTAGQGLLCTIDHCSYGWDRQGRP